MAFILYFELRSRASWVAPVLFRACGRLAGGIGHALIVLKFLVISLSMKNFNIRFGILTTIVMWIWPFEVAWKLRSVLQAQLRGTKRCKCIDFESLRNLMKPLMCVREFLLKPRVGAVCLMGMMRREGVTRKEFQTGM